MSTTFKYLSLVTASFLLLACGGGGSSSSGGTITAGGGGSDLTSLPNVSKNITITGTYQIEDLGKASQVKAIVNVGTAPKSVYVLLSNSSETKSSSPRITHNNKIAPMQKNMKEISVDVPTIHAKRAKHAPAYIQSFNQNTKKLFKNSKKVRKEKLVNTNLKPNKKDILGQSNTFYIESDTSKSTMATSRKIVSNIATDNGNAHSKNKTLNIWVSNDSFGIGCGKTKCVTQAMVDALAETFLKVGPNNDIYDWVTNIYGEEWNAAAKKKYDYFIGANDEITILLTDIGNDDSVNGGTIGYFFAKDNVDKTYVDSKGNVLASGSNERVMFYIDAVMFANEDPGTPWSIDDAWPKEVVATLAHEFVHMIHFYQKTLMLIPDDGEDTDTWINEMTAETTEDLVATKIQSSGPRGVTHTDGSAGDPKNMKGRYGIFNENNTLSLTTWSGKLPDYSKVNAFGTYLTRNYGGAQVLHDIMHNAYGDEQAIIDAVRKSPQGAGKTFSDLQKEWGIAVLLSDNETLAVNKPTYNTGAFTNTTYKSVTYELGSINFFNYSPKPTISTSVSTVAPQGNYYYKVGDDLTGTVTIDLTLNATTSATLIVK